MRALFELMATQHAVATTTQARSLGVSSRVQRRLVERGVLTSPATGVLLAGGCAPTFVTRAMAASLAPGVAAVSHGAAARLHGLAGFTRHEVVDVLAGKGADPPHGPGVVVHSTRGPIGDFVTLVDGVRVLTIPATLALLAPVSGVDRTRRALDDALAKGVTVADLRRAAAAWRQRGRPGPAALLALLRLARS